MKDGLHERMRSPGYTPGARDVAHVFDLLASDDDRVARDAERALARLGLAAARRAAELFDASAPPLRGRLAALVGRVAASTRESDLDDWLVARLEDRDPRTRRRAVRALGKLADPRFEAPLVHAWDRAALPEERRAVATALGNVGGAEALGRLETAPLDDPELARLVREAKLKIARAGLRGATGGM